ncbi:MAG: AtpZ/AtpI family protein [Deltaproteobacteria bacterium]|nr:MAG: AtpZ/AtpI family protein [Deltaproteobacteria bacterium]
MKKSPDKEDPFLIAYGIYGAVGFQLATSVVGGVLGGQWLDKRWGTSPWLTLVGLVLGAVAGFYNLIKILNWKDNRTQ